tara:strand:- start:42612 stop:45074 length:2463 start_codon:yes stop_codon:yes gene_type:complete
MILQRESFRLLVISCFLTLLIFLIDLQVPLNLAVPFFYAVTIFFVAGQPRIWPLLLAASICSALTLYRLFPGPVVAFPPLTWESRYLSLSVIWVTALGSIFRLTQWKNRTHELVQSLFQNGHLAQVPALSTGNGGAQKENRVFMSAVNNREFEWLGKKTLKPDIETRMAELARMNENLRREILERKRIETQLLTANKRTQDILDSLFVFVGVYSTEGILLEINRCPLEAAKLNKRDVIGKPFWNTYWWSYSTETQAQLEQAFQRAATGETVRFDTKARLSEQKRMDLDITFGPLFDEAGNVIQIIGSAVDITDRLIAEKKVAQKTAHLHAMLEVNPDLFFHLSADGTIVGYECGDHKKLYLPPEEFLDRKVHDILPRHVVELFEAAQQELGLSHKTASFEYTLKINEQICWFQARLFPYLSDEILVIIQDINDRKLSEIEINNMHTRLFEAQRLAHIGSWEWNTKEETLWWSEEVYRIFGLNNSGFQPNYEAFLEIIHPDDRDLVRRVIENTLKNDLPFSIEHRIVRANGEIRYVLEQAALKKSIDGETLLMHGTIQDITERQEANRMVQEYRDELAHVSRLAVMGELAAGLSHELNQPLTAIANYSSCMRNVLEQGGDISEFITKIEMQSLRSGEIVRRLKSLAAKRKQQRLLFNIHDCIRSAIQLINYKIRLQQIQVNLVAENNFTTVYADRVQIEQVLVNLIKNAVEAMEETPLPRILTITTTSTADSTVVISVTDTGAGIPDTFKKRLFTPFATSKKEGLGIGLSLSRSLVDASGGTMWYRPNSKGGAIFHISLPASQTQNKSDWTITKNEWGPCP